MFSIFIFICVFIINTSALQLNDVILCRTCGNTIAHSNAIIEKRSLLSLKTFNDTLFGSENVIIQILTKDIIFHFPIIITNYSNCIGLGEWEEDEELWFSGYRWRPCLCPDCGVLVGWLFEKYNPLGSHNSFHEERHQFYALILPNLVSQKFEDKAFLAACEEEFKDRYTENDEEFMKVLNAEPSIPPIIENWYISNRSGGRFTPYNRDRCNRDRGYHGRRDQGRRDEGYRRGYHDYEQYTRDRGYRGRKDEGSGNRGYIRGYNDYEQHNRDRGQQGRDEGSCNTEYRRGYNDYEQGDNHNNRDRFQRRQ